MMKTTNVIKVVCPKYFLQPDIVILKAFIYLPFPFLLFPWLSTLYLAQTVIYMLRFLQAAKHWNDLNNR